MYLIYVKSQITACSRLVSTVLPLVNAGIGGHGIDTALTRINAGIHYIGTYTLPR